MRSINELQKRLQPSNNFQARYNIEPDDKVHLLYVSPTLNATGYYRMIAPALEINTSQTHKAIITSIENYDFSRKLSDYVNQLDERLITWADYIIFPSLFSEMSYLIQAIKALNPQVQLVMDIDRNYFALTNIIPLSRKLTQEKLKHLETNLGLMDLATVANQPFQKFLQKFIANRLPKSNTLASYLPSLVSRFGYEEMPPLKRNTSEKLRVGILKPTEEDFLSLKEVLLDINSSHKGSIQFVCFGKSHISKEVDKLLEEIDCELHNSVSFLDYFEKLNSLALDIVLLPAKEGLYYRHQNIQTFLELSVFGIPVVSSIHHPVSTYIQDGENGFLADTPPERKQAVTAFVTNTELQKVMGKNVLKTVWKHHSFNARTIERLTDMFI